MKIAIAFACLSLSHFAFASGTVTGNGGKMLMCQNQTNTTYTLLDFFEGHDRGLDVQLGAPEISWQDKVKMAVDRLTKYDIDRAERLQKLADGFISDAVFYTDRELPTTDDTGRIAIPYGCKIVQAAVQFQKEFPEDKTFWMDNRIWSQLDNDNKAGLILHEIIFKEFIRMGEENSYHARYFNSILFSGRIAGLTEFSYIQLGKKLNSKFVVLRPEIAGIRFRSSNDLVFSEDGSLKYGFLENALTVHLAGTEVTFQGGTQLGLFPSQKVRFGTILPVRISMAGGIVPADKSAFFFEDGSLQMTGINNRFQYIFEGASALVMGTDVSFDPQGAIFSAVFATPVKIKKYGKIMMVVEVKNKSSYSLSEPIDVDMGECSYAVRGISFFENGAVENLSLFRGLNAFICVRGKKISAGFIHISFTKNGTLYNASGYTDSLKLPMFDGDIEFDFRNGVLFHPNGFVKRGLIFADAILTGTDGLDGSYESGTWINFDESGRVVSVGDEK